MSKTSTAQLCEFPRPGEIRGGSSKDWMVHAHFERSRRSLIQTIDADLPKLIGKVTQAFQEQWLNAVRMKSFEQELLVLKDRIATVQRSVPTIIPIDTLAPEPYEIIKSFHITLEKHEDEYKAAFEDANLSAFGETRNEAVWNLKDILIATFDAVTDIGEENLGAGLARQAAVLKAFIRRQE